ncbi:hypothetical protein LIS82_02420 [Cytobacillus solani]|uniref:hypothetical protein n=1 Tax=Cytobacillus solani TaxID=1637975 RepID=UPI00207941C5|nr:hypothetical protein [Cytobacillus solani]USK55428.1 hypothetical protein LIS82_02420 [Cytobacillus solani]
MKLNEVERFEEFLSESFGDGVHIRELRLSNEETEYIKKTYPKAIFNKSFQKETLDEKNWYKVTLLPPTKKDNQDEITAIQQENLRLKQEIEVLRRTMKVDKGK